MVGVKRGSRRLTESEFAEVIRQSRMTPTSIEIARSVLVNGLSQVEVAKNNGLSEARTSKIVGAVWDAHTARQLSMDSVSMAKDLTGKVEMVQADMDVAVLQLRQLLGNRLEIKQPEQHAQYTGPIIHRSDFFAIQDVGKQSVVFHRLSQLDVLPSLNSRMTIAYSGGQGKVLQRDGKSHQSSLGR